MLDEQSVMGLFLLRGAFELHLNYKPPMAEYSLCPLARASEAISFFSVVHVTVPGPKIVYHMIRACVGIIYGVLHAKSLQMERGDLQRKSKPVSGCMGTGAMQLAMGLDLRS